MDSLYDKALHYYKMEKLQLENEDIDFGGSDPVFLNLYPRTTRKRFTEEEIQKKTENNREEFEMLFQISKGNYDAFKPN